MDIDYVDDRIQIAADLKRLKELSEANNPQKEEKKYISDKLDPDKLTLDSDDSIDILRYHLSKVDGVTLKYDDEEHDNE